MMPAARKPQPRQAPAAKSAASARKSTAQIADIHDAMWQELQDAAQDSPVQTIVPDAFSRMPDDVLAVAMQSYQRQLADGRPNEYAIIDAVGDAKTFARDNNVPYRKPE